MGSIPMKTLTIGENVFEIVDEQARNNIETLTNDIKNIIVEETDPTVPNWAKEPNKPTYTASEVGALPSTTKIPTKTSELDNDSGFLTSVPSEYVTDEELERRAENITAVAHRELELKVVELQDQMSEYVHYDGTQGEPPINALLLSDADGEQYVIPYLKDYLIKPYNLPEANESTRGAMSAEDKQKLNNLPENLDLYVTETELTSKGYAKQSDVNSLSEEIADLKGAEIPDYWESHLAEKIETIKALHRQYGKDCFSFVHIADMHYPSNLGKRSPLLANKVMEETQIKNALLNGDLQTRGCHSTKEQLLAENELILIMLEPLIKKALLQKGNHDGAHGTLDKDGDGTISNYDSDGNIKEPADRETYVHNLTPQEFHEYMYRKVGMVGDVHFDETGTAYYIDDVTNNARFIGLNTQCNDYELQEDGTQKYPTMWLMRFTQPQFDFLINEALVNGVTDRTKIVVFGHVPLWQEIGDRDVMCGVLKAYKDKSTYKGTYAGTAEGEGHTNQIPISTDASGNVYNGTGYKDGYRFNSSHTEATLTGAFITGFIPVKAGDTVYLNGNYIDATSSLASSMRHELYKSDKTTRVGAINMGAMETTGQAISSFEVNDDGYVTKFTLSPTWDYTAGWSEIAYIRLNLIGSGEGCVVTVNEEIVEGAVSGYDAVSVDCDFTEAKGKFVGYFSGHVHYDHNTSDKGFPIITSRCDGHEENDETLYEERVAGTITEQSFDVFTVTPNKIYATKIGAGSDRVIDY